MKNRLLALLVLLLTMVLLENRRQRQTIVQLEAVKAEYDAEKRREAEIEKEGMLFEQFLAERHPKKPLSAERQERLNQRLTSSKIDFAFTEIEFEEWKEKRGLEQMRIEG
ncbi:MAG: hypothetical protein SF029_02760 [bacterium]|nr:hypothetical protein [bacterium]